MAANDKSRDVRDYLEAIVARCKSSPDPRALLIEQLKELRGVFDRTDLARMYREAVRRLDPAASETC